MNEHRKTVVSVTEMARMCNLSRQRFYQLMGTAFPYPVYNIATRKPFYTDDLQHVCLEVRKKNCGINGKPVLFYTTSRSHGKEKPSCGDGSLKGGKRKAYMDLIGGVQKLGLSVEEGHVIAAIKQLFPSGIDGVEKGEVLKAVFLHLKQRESAGNTGTPPELPPE